MRLALAISGQRPSSEAVQLARLAEDLGFAEVWLTEDYCERGAFSLAGAVAVATERARVGIGVINPWTRHPVLSAMETAALTELAPGRIVLGFGASNPRWMEEQLGIPFVRPLSALAEAVELTRAALDGARVEHEGGRYRVDTELAFTPVGEVPIVLGVKGPRALDLAGEIADGVLLSVLSSPDYVRWARARVGDIHLSSYVSVSCDRDGEAARERIRPFVAAFLGIHGDHAITREAGLDADRARAFREGWRTGFPRVDLVDDDLLDIFAVAGAPDHCVERIGAFADAGLDTLVVHDQRAPDMHAYLERIRDLHRSAVAAA